NRSRMLKAKLVVFVSLAMAATWLAPLTERAAAQAGGAGKEEELPILKITGGVSLLKLALPRAEGGGEARVADETMSKDMDVSGFFQVLDPNSFPQALQAEGLGF